MTASRQHQEPRNSRETSADSLFRTVIVIKYGDAGANVLNHSISSALVNNFMAHLFTPSEERQFLKADPPDEQLAIILPLLVNHCERNPGELTTRGLPASLRFLRYNNGVQMISTIPTAVGPIILTSSFDENGRYLRGVCISPGGAQCGEDCRIPYMECWACVTIAWELGLIEKPPVMSPSFPGDRR